MKAKQMYYLFHLYSNINKGLAGHATSQALFSSVDQHVNAIVDSF